MNYTVVLEPDDDGQGYTVRVPALPGCVTQGRTREEALERAKEAIAGFIEGLKIAGDPVPEEKEPVELATVAV
jgi:predicted RNase H-like HicB family nuclease